MRVASPWGFSDMAIQSARHECHACCLLRAGFLAFQPVVDNTRGGTRVERVVSSFRKILRGSQLTWYTGASCWWPVVERTVPDSNAHGRSKRLSGFSCARASSDVFSIATVCFGKASSSFQAELPIRTPVASESAACGYSPAKGRPILQTLPKVSSLRALASTPKRQHKKSKFLKRNVIALTSSYSVGMRIHYRKRQVSTLQENNEFAEVVSRIGKSSACK